MGKNYQPQLVSLPDFFHQQSLFHHLSMKNWPDSKLGVGDDNWPPIVETRVQAIFEG